MNYPKINYFCFVFLLEITLIFWIHDILIIIVNVEMTFNL